MGKFLNMLENHIGFCTKGLSKKDSLDGDSFLQTTYGEWLCSKKKQCQELFSTAIRFKAVKGWSEADLKRLHIIIKESHTSTLI